VVAHPSLNNKVVGLNPRSSIFLRGQAGAPQLHFFRGQVGAAGRGQAGPRCGRLGPRAADHGLSAAGWGQVRPAVALAQLGWGQVRPAGARCGQPGLARVRPGLVWARSRLRLTTTGWDLADRGHGVAGRGRSQPLPPFVIFLHFFNISLHL
jgi:hypothetical protein